MTRYKSILNRKANRHSCAKLKTYHFSGEGYKWWIIGNEMIPRNPHKYQQYKALARGVLWGAGSKKYEINFI